MQLCKIISDHQWRISYMLKGIKNSTHKEILSIKDWYFLLRNMDFMTEICQEQKIVHIGRNQEFWLVFIFDTMKGIWHRQGLKFCPQLIFDKGCDMKTAICGEIPDQG